MSCSPWGEEEEDRVEHVVENRVEHFVTVNCEKAVGYKGQGPAGAALFFVALVSAIVVFACSSLQIISQLEQINKNLEHLDNNAHVEGKEKK